MHIALLALSVLFLIAFYVAGTFVFNKNNPDDTYDIRNHFSFELWIKKGHQGVFIDVFMLLSATIFAANYILFSIKNFSVLNIFNAVLALLIAFSVISITYLPLSKLKERCILSIILITGTTILNALEIYESFTLIRQYENNLLYIPLVISAVIVIIGIIAIFYPKLFDFGMEKNEEGVMKRPSFFPLAFFEWLLIFTCLLSQSFIVIASMI